MMILHSLFIIFHKKKFLNIFFQGILFVCFIFIIYQMHASWIINSQISLDLYSHTTFYNLN